MCSDEAANPGAGALGGAVGWEELPAPPSPVDCAQHRITGHPSLPQRLKSQISELVNQSFLCCHSRKTFLGAYFRTRGIAPLLEIFTSFLYLQKVPVKGRQQGPLDAFRLQPLPRQYFTAVVVSVPGNHDSSFPVCSSSRRSPGLQCASSSTAGRRTAASPRPAGLDRIHPNFLVQGQMHKLTPTFKKTKSFQRLKAQNKIFRGATRRGSEVCSFTSLKVEPPRKVSLGFPSLNAFS